MTRTFENVRYITHPIDLAKSGDLVYFWRNMESKPSSPAKEATCGRCGRFDAVEFGDHVLCPDCIAEAGCACAEREDPAPDPSKQ